MIRTYPDIGCREEGAYARAEARSEDDGVAEGALRRGRTTQLQAEHKTLLPTRNIGIGSKQFIPGKVCVKCQGCCRFLEADSIWQPVLLENEAKSLVKNKRSACCITPDKKICLVPFEDKDIFYCAFFNVGKNKCRIYSRRPLDCQLYPFLINRRGSKIYLSIDLNCPFIKEDVIKSRVFQKYADYLIKLLTGGKYRRLFKNNPQFVQHYPEAKDIAELKL